MGDSSPSSQLLSSSSSSPSKKRKKNLTLSDDEFKEMLVSSSLALVKSFRTEFGISNATSSSSSITRFELLSFSDDDSRVRLAHLLGSLLNHATAATTTTTTMEVFSTMTSQLVDINNMISTATTTTTKKKFQFVVMTDDDNATPIIINNPNNDNKFTEILNMVELLLMMMINVLAKTNTNTESATMFISNVNTITTTTSTTTTATTSDKTSILQQALAHFLSKDISNILNLISSSSNDGNIMLSFMTMMASDLYLLQYNSDNTTTSRSNNNNDALTDTVIARLTGYPRYYMNSFVYFLARTMNSNIYSTSISPTNILTLSSSSSSSSSSWTMHATLVFLLTSLRGVDSDAKRSLANSKEFCENLIIASVSSPIEDDDDIVDDDNDNNTDDDDNNIIMITVNIIKILLTRLDAPSLHAFLKRVVSSLR